MDSPRTIDVRAVGAEAVRDLRREVLRPGQSDAELHYPGDEDPDSLHVAVLGDGRVLAAASIMREGLPGEGRPQDWRIRGMACAPALRGRGIGTQMLARCIAHARERGARRVWCNARVGARSLYERAGLRVRGEPFDIPPIGVHLLMVGEPPDE